MPRWVFRLQAHYEWAGTQNEHGIPLFKILDFSGKTAKSG